jgi:dienelactone hydrolase
VDDGEPQERTVRQVGARIPVGDAEIVGDLTVPNGARGVVLFAHGSGSSRFSSRNRSVAEALNDRSVGTALVDLLTEDEEKVDRVTRRLRFDIPMLTHRVVDVVRWAAGHPSTAGLRIGLFGASTGAAAALGAAARLPLQVAAVVSRGGRPDLARDDLPAVQAPTLLIVGGRDTEVITLNEQARDLMACEVALTIVPGASHLFEEPGALEQVTQLAGDWFTRQFTPARGE